jgi:hypothetical protein
MIRRTENEAGYDPVPSSFDDIDIPPNLEGLIEALAELNHDTWARFRLDTGWVYGVERDDARRLHPCLVPYDDLPEDEKDVDRNTVRAVIRTILGSGFRIVRDPNLG